MIPIADAATAVELHPLYAKETTKIIQSQLQELLPYAGNFLKLEILLTSSLDSSCGSLSSSPRSSSLGIALYCEMFVTCPAVHRDEGGGAFLCATSLSSSPISSPPPPGHSGRKEEPSSSPLSGSSSSPKTVTTMAEKERTLISIHVFFPLQYPEVPPVLRGKFMDPAVAAQLRYPTAGIGSGGLGHPSGQDAGHSEVSPATRHLFLCAFGSPFVQRSQRVSPMWNSTHGPPPCCPPAHPTTMAVPSIQEAAAISTDPRCPSSRRGETAIMNGGEEEEEEARWGVQVDLEHLQPFLAVEEEEVKLTTSGGVPSLPVYSLLGLLVAVKEVFESFVPMEEGVAAVFASSDDMRYGHVGYRGVQRTPGMGRIWQVSLGDRRLQERDPDRHQREGHGIPGGKGGGSATATTDPPRRTSHVSVSSPVDTSSAVSSFSHLTRGGGVGTAVPSHRLSYTPLQLQVGTALCQALYRQAGTYLSLRQRALPMWMELQYVNHRLQSTLEALKRKKAALRTFLPSKHAPPLSTLIRKLEQALRKDMEGGGGEVSGGRGAALHSAGTSSAVSGISEGTVLGIHPVPDTTVVPHDATPFLGGGRSSSSSSASSPKDLPPCEDLATASSTTAAPRALHHSSPLFSSAGGVGVGVADRCLVASEIVRKIFIWRAEIEAGMDVLRLLDQMLHHQQLSCEDYVQHILHTAHDLFFDRFLLSRGETQWKRALHRNPSPSLGGAGEGSRRGSLSAATVERSHGGEGKLPPSFMLPFSSSFSSSSSSFSSSSSPTSGRGGEERGREESPPSTERHSQKLERGEKDTTPPSPCSPPSLVAPAAAVLRLTSQQTTCERSEISSDKMTNALTAPPHSHEVVEEADPSFLWNIDIHMASHPPSTTPSAAQREVGDATSRSEEEKESRTNERGGDEEEGTEWIEEGVKNRSQEEEASPEWEHQEPFAIESLPSPLLGHTDERLDPTEADATVLQVPSSASSSLLCEDAGEQWKENSEDQVETRNIESETVEDESEKKDADGMECRPRSTSVGSAGTPVEKEEVMERMDMAKSTTDMEKRKRTAAFTVEPSFSSGADGNTREVEEVLAGAPATLAHRAEEATELCFAPIGVPPPGPVSCVLEEGALLSEDTVVHPVECEGCPPHIARDSSHSTASSSFSHPSSCTLAEKRHHESHDGNDENRIFVRPSKVEQTSKEEKEGT